MNPTSHKQFYSKVSNELGYPAEEVQYIVDFYWKQVRKTMEEQKDYRINVDQIGDFIVLRKKLKRRVEIYKNKIERLTMKDYKTFPLYQTIDSKINAFEGLMAQYDEERERRRNLKQDRRDGKI